MSENTCQIHFSIKRAGNMQTFWMFHKYGFSLEILI